MQNLKKYILIFLFLTISYALMLAPAVNSAEITEKKDVIIGIDRLVSTETLEDNISAQGGEVDKEFEIINAVKARIPRRAVTTLSSDPAIRYIEEDKTVYALAADGLTGGQEVPWGIERIFAGEKYSFSTWEKAKGEGVGVAVLDTGIDKNHENLPTPVDGVNTLEDDDTHWGVDENGHGTFVSGPIAALDNELGIVGSAPGADLFAVKVLGEDGSGPLSSVIEGIEWSVKQDIPVINMSLGIYFNLTSLQEACQKAYEEGHLLVAAGGNEGGEDNVAYPARYDSVVAVSASDENDDITDFSDIGAEIELTAPGENIISVYPDDEYAQGDGTSFSAPHVSGISALLWSADLNLDNTEVRKILEDTAEDLELDSDKQGSGLSRADRAVAEVKGKDLEVSEVEIVSGDSNILIPKKGKNSYDFEAEVYDQHGKIMEEEEVDWSLSGLSDLNNDYTEINNGVLTVQAKAEEDDIKVIAVSDKNDEVYEEKVINLEYDFKLRTGELKVLNIKEGVVLALPEGFVTEPIDGERLEEINIEEFSDYGFIDVGEKITFDFTDFKLEDRRDENQGDVNFILKDRENRELAKLTLNLEE